ncbi:TPA: hypothetical protein KLD26_002432 [Legionella pneumophila]|nr:hypothetical protein [Legionella pneumophila]
MFGSKIKAFQRDAEKHPLTKKEQANELLLLNTILNKLNIAIPALIRIINTYYVPFKLSDFTSPEPFISQLDELKKQMEPSETLPDRSEGKVTTKRNSMKRHSIHSLERHSLFRPGNEPPISGNGTDLKPNI